MKTLITRIKRLALALCFVTPLVSWAAEPVAVWEGDFSPEALNKFSSAGITLVDWQQTHGGINHGSDPASDYSSVTIDRSNQGLMADFTSAKGAFTVLVKYSGLAASSSSKRVLFATTANSDYTRNRCGLRLLTDGTVKGLWNNQTSSNNDADWGDTTAGALPSSGTLAFRYSSGTDANTGGITLYHAADGADFTDTKFWYGNGLRAGNQTGFAIGGMCRNVSLSGVEAAQGMTISAIAVFTSVLTPAEMNAYVWPSEIETIPVTGDTSFSALNAIVAASEARSIVLSLDDGATVTVDEAFAAASVPVVIASEGSITLSAESQPDASYFTNADFSGVKGGLLRSWLTPGVVGINFCSSVGSDTSGALVNCSNWISDEKGHNDKTGTVTSSALFSDGLSVATWYYANTWSSGSGTLINGYLDDGSKNGNGAEVHISNVPYQTYDVVIYCNSDSNPGNFLAKTVNGTTYTWDSDAGAVVEGSGTWGKAALALPVYGVNALRIKNLTGPLTIYGSPRNSSSRGCIAAIQIMPPDTPDNIRTYTLTLDGTDTTWSDGTWTLEGDTVDAPTAGTVKIVASASTTVTVDSAVSLATLTVENSTDAVVSLVPGENGSISTINATVKSGVLKQSAENLVAGTLTVEDGGTFDFGGFAPQANVRIAGDGDGNYPWALTSTGDAPLGNWTSLILDADATVGGTGKITFGKDNTAGTINYNGHTLTKTGSGEFVLYNGRTVTDGTGTLDIVGGKVTLSQYTCIDGYETIYAHTTVIVRNGAELNNNTNRRVWIDTLTVEDGARVTTDSAKPFGITTALVTEGALTTTKLQFNDDATVTLGGDLTLTDFVAKGDDENTTVGDVALVLADGTASATVTVSGTVDAAVGTVSVGSGITPVFSGTSDVTATLSYAADPSPTESTALAFTQQDNWKGTVVLDYAITGGSGGSVFQPGKYGNANSTVCLGQGASDIFLSVRDKSFYGDIGTKLYFKGDVSLRNGWGSEAKATTIPQLGADEGVTFTTRQGAITSNGTTYYTITSLKDFAGTIALSDLTAVTIGNVEMDALPEKGALVVKATTGTGTNKGTISGSVTVNDETVALVFDTVNDVSGLYRPSTVDITIPTVDNATVAVTVDGVAVTPENGVVTAQVGSAVVVTYTAADGYTIANGTIEFTADANTTTVDTTSVTVSEYIAWIYDVNGNLVGNPYTTELAAVQPFLANNIGNSIRFKTSIESSEEGSFHQMLISVCSYDSETLTYTRLPVVANVTSGQFTVGYTSLASAVANVLDGSVVTLVANVTLEERVEPNLGENTTLTIDLGGYTLTREGTSGNGSVFDVKSGTVTIKNGTIDCTQDDTDIVKDGVYAITARSGSAVTLEGLTITVDSQAGACVYPFNGATVTIKSGTYRNETAEEYQYKTGWTGMAVNQANVTTQLLFIEGGKFWQVNPEEGDDSGMVTNFLAADRIATLVDGYWTVSKVEIDPSAVVINYNSYATLSVTGYPEGATFGWTIEGPVKISNGKKTATVTVYSETTASDGVVARVAITNGEDVIEREATITVADVAAKIGETEYTKAELNDAIAAAIASGEVLEHYLAVSTTISKGQTLKTKKLAERNGTASVKAAASTTAGEAWAISKSDEDEDGVITWSVETETPIFEFTSEDGETVEYLAAPKNAAGVNKLLSDATITKQFSVTKDGVVLDLNGHALTSTYASNSAGAVYVNVIVPAPAALTVKDSVGGGSIAAASAHSVFMLGNNGQLTVEGGSFTGKHIVYGSKTTSVATITGGTFEADDVGFTLNMLDSARGTITVTGGTFTGFNPANNAAEGAGTNFVPDGYVSTETSTGVWTVAEVQEVPVEAGAQTDPVDTEAAAQADAAKVVPTVPAAVAAKLSDDQETAYKALFEPKVVTVTVGESTKYAVAVELKDTVVTALQTAVDAEAEDLATAAVAAAADATNGGKATVATTPGLYYVVEAGTEPNGTAPVSCTLAESGSTTLTIPNKGAKGFYKIRVSVTPVDVE